jgi:hypothetical protein
MDDKIIATFCLCDDLLKAMHHPEDRQCQMNADFRRAKTINIFGSSREA